MNDRFVYNYSAVWFHQKLHKLDRDSMILVINIFTLDFIIELLNYMAMLNFHVYDIR